MNPDAWEVLKAGLLAGCGRHGVRKEKSNNMIRIRWIIPI